MVLLLGWSFASLVGYIVLLFSLSDFAQAMGMSVRRAADVTGMVNVGTALGRPFVGALSDRWGRIEVAGVVTAVCGVSVFAVWVPAEGEAVVMLFAVVAGATLGTFWVAIGPLCVEVVGLVELPALLSLAWMVIVVPCTGEWFLFICVVLCCVLTPVSCLLACLVLSSLLSCLLSCPLSFVCVIDPRVEIHVINSSYHIHRANTTQSQK